MKTNIVNIRMSIKKPRGTRDFSPREMEGRDYIENSIIKIFESYNYRKILTPTFEYAELFRVKSGEEIQEHMYVFEDKSGRILCLRPEATASVCRMFAEELRGYKLPLKLYYSCPMFRYERPQKGRYREFWHLGIELIGPRGPESDAEVISIANNALERIGLRFRLEIGHMGIIRALMHDLGIDEKIQDTLIAAIDKGEIKKLKTLVGGRTLLDLIEISGDNAIEMAENLLKEYKNAGKALGELKDVLRWLDSTNVAYDVNLGIARGLEYYTGTVFEIRVSGLGAQDQICGGGRYDNLIELFSGLSVPAVGFAFGFDRVMNAIELQGIEIPEKTTDVVIAPVNETVREEALKIASLLREDANVDMDLMDRKLERILKHAADIKVKYAVIVGPEDLKRGEVTVRDMKTGEQRKIKIENLRNEMLKIDR
jgi:histidyl-tRNA synthetase